MLCENIKKYRLKSGMSQQELAERLNVVRQTVSKWESGRSVPGADSLMAMAQIFSVSPNRLLDAEGDLEAEIERLSLRRERLREAGKVRGKILFISFSSMLRALAVKSEIFSALLSGICRLACLFILCRNMDLLTGTEGKNRSLKAVTIFDLRAVASALVLTAVTGRGAALTEEGEKGLAALRVCRVMAFAGYISPKLPFNRHTGLRLPWTVRDEDTWNVAHRVIGCISLPAALVYIARAATVTSFEAVTRAAVTVWLCLPAGISYLYFLKKTGAKL